MIAHKIKSHATSSAHFFCVVAAPFRYRNQTCFFLFLLRVTLGLLTYEFLPSSWKFCFEFCAFPFVKANFLSISLLLELLLFCAFSSSVITDRSLLWWPREESARPSMTLPRRRRRRKKGSEEKRTTTTTEKVDQRTGCFVL